MSSFRWEAGSDEWLRHSPGMDACRKAARDTAALASALLPIYTGDPDDYGPGMLSEPSGALKASVRITEGADARGEFVAVAANIVDLFLEEPAEQYKGVRRPGIRAALDMQSGRVIS